LTVPFETAKKLDPHVQAMLGFIMSSGLGIYDPGSAGAATRTVSRARAGETVIHVCFDELHVEMQS
jgi:hypothetical protein